MLESLRKHSKFVMILLFLLIIPSFIFFGVDQSYFSVASPTVARVDGQEITQNDWDNMHRYESDRLRAENPNIDANCWTRLKRAMPHWSAWSAIVSCRLRHRRCTC